MPFTEDLTVFFNVNDFGTAATYTPSVGSPKTVNGIFDRAYREVIDGIEGTSPAFVCALSDVSTVVHGNTFVINSATYKVRGVEPDGVGTVLLRLEAQ